MFPGTRPRESTCVPPGGTTSRALGYAFKMMSVESQLGQTTLSWMKLKKGQESLFFKT